MKRKRNSKMKNNQTQQKIVLRWAISYLPAILIPLILGGLLYTYSMHAVQEKAETIQYTMLEDRTDALADVFDKVGNLTIQIQGNSEVNAIASANSWSGEERFQLMEVQDLLSELVMNNEEIEEISLYFPSKNQILTTNSAYSVTSERELQSRMGMNQDQFYKMMSEDIYGTYHMEGKLLYTSAYKKNVHFLKQKMIVLVTLSAEYMDYLLHSEEVDFFLVKDNQQMYVAKSSISGDPSDPMIGEISLQDAMALSFADGPMQWIDNTCVYRDHVETYGLDLYSIQSDVGYVKALWDMRLLLVAYVLFCLVAGGLLLWYQTRKNYRPVDEMLTVIRRHGYLDGKELATAGQALQQLVDAFESRKDEVVNRDAVILSHAMHQLFYPDDEHMSWGDEMTYGLFCSKLDGDIRQLVRFNMAAPEETGLDRDLLGFMFQNVLSEILEDRVKFIFALLENRFYLFAGASSDGTDPIKKEEMETISRFFTEQCGIDVSIEISGIQEGWAGVHVAYDQMRALGEYRSFLPGYHPVITYQELCGEAILEELYQVFSLERKIKLKVHSHQLESMEKDLDAYRKHMSSELMMEWRGVHQVEEEDAGSRITDAVQAYIDENYTDKQLTVGSLADMFEVSTPWLSRNFKKEKDCGVLEYIGQLRMEKAKELLLTGLSVTETAERVGYYSSRPLIRLFTEKVGMTPMKYVKSQLGEAEEMQGE